MGCKINDYMDKHLNLFYSYDRGNTKNPDRVNQLEDNITRAFIVTLKNLSVKYQTQFFKSIIGVKLKYGNVIYGLQNISAEFSNRKIFKKVFVTIGSVESSFKKHELLSYRISKFQFEKKKVDSQKFANELDLIFKLIDDEVSNKILKSKLDIFSNKYELGDYLSAFKEKNEIKSKLLFLKELLKGCRLDAWICDKRYFIGFESKLNDYPFVKSQLVRHIRDKENGLSLSKNEDIIIINTTWNKILKFFETLLKSSEKNSKDHFLLENIIKYIVMAQKRLDLAFLIKDENYNEEVAKEQFPLLLKEFDRRIKSDNDLMDRLERSNRAKSVELWEGYDLKNSNGLLHYSIYLFEDYSGIALTINNKNMIKNILTRNSFIDYLNKLMKQENRDVLLSRYSLDLLNYRIIDWIKGVQKGENQTTFKLEFNLQEVKRSKLSISKLLDPMLNYLPISKQLDFKFIIHYPDIKKIKTDSKQFQIRKENKKYFEDYNLLISSYISFIKETLKILK